MALNPYPSLATLPEIVANGGYIPARSIDAFAINSRFASDILKQAGVVPNCNIRTGAVVGTGSLNDCANALNVFLDGATETSPRHLIVDCGMAIGKMLKIKPHTTITTLSGRAQWDVGFYVIPGSHCGAIGCWSGDTDHDHFLAIHPAGAQTIAGTNVTLAGFFVNCNRGTYPNGANNNYQGDGTLTSNGAYVNDAKGPTNYYYLGGITIVGVENLTIDNVWVYDACAYGIDLYHCTHITITKCRVECVDSQTDGNTDAFHINGSCMVVRIDGCFGKSGDDVFALNLHEGDGGSGSDIIITNCVVDGLTLGRFYGISTTGLNKVQLRGITGIVRWWGMLVGEGNTLVDNVVNSNRSIQMKDIDVQITHGDGPLPPAMLIVAANVGLLDMDGISIVDPVVAHSLIYMSSLTGVVSKAAINNVNICRSALGNSVVNLLTGVKGSVTTLAVSGWSTADIAGSNYPAPPNFLDLTSPCTIGRLWIGDVDPTHTTALTNAAGQITTKAGPGLAASGF